MPDLNIELAIDALCTAVESVSPRRVTAIVFERHKDRDAELEDYDDVLGFRKFEWVDATVGNGSPASDSSTAWYSYDMELRIFYPKAFWADDDLTYRGITGIRLSDIIDLNKVLMFGDPFSAQAFSYTKLQMRRTRRQGKLLIIPYLIQIQEDL